MMARTGNCAVACLLWATALYRRGRVLHNPTPYHMTMTAHNADGAQLQPQDGAQRDGAGAQRAPHATYKTTSDKTTAHNTSVPVARSYCDPFSPVGPRNPVCRCSAQGCRTLAAAAPRVRQPVTVRRAPLKLVALLVFTYPFLATYTLCTCARPCARSSSRAEGALRCYSVR